MSFKLENIIRENVKRMAPYSSARDEYSGAAAIFLDANENPFDTGLNRYPDPYQWELKEAISKIKKVAAENIFLGNGSDEPIDLLFRAFCEPAKDNVVAIAPTYGMYKVCADVNNVEYRNVLLGANYELSANKLLDACDNNTKAIFICTPNNPTANARSPTEIEKVIASTNALVILDEAYIDFSEFDSFTGKLNQYPNLIILQTFSKAWGLAGMRLGMAYASDDIVKVFNKIKYPYNINILTQNKALEILRENNMQAELKEILSERNKLCQNLETLPFVEKILPSQTNFLMVKVKEPAMVMNYLLSKKIIVRDRSKVQLCEGYLRITVGTPTENKTLLSALQEL